MSVPLMILPMHHPVAAEHEHSYPILPLPTQLLSLLRDFQSGCMDRTHHGWGSSDSAQIQALSSHTPLRDQPSRADLSSQHPSSSPLPQSQWAEVPVSYRPLEWIDAGHGDSNPDPSYAWRLRRPISGNNLSSAEQSAQEHRHQRSRHLRNLFHRHGDRPRSQVTDHSALYPPVDPYSDFAGTLHARDQFQQVRSVSQPASANLRRTPSMRSLGAPTYPPSTSHRTRIVTPTDEALADLEDFHLFAQATAGLESEQSFPFSNAASSHASQQQQRPWLVLPPSDDGSDSSTVPVEAETPTMMHAYQHIASMPQQLEQTAVLPARAENPAYYTIRPLQPCGQQPFLPSPPHDQNSAPSADIPSWQHPPSESILPDLEALGLGDLSPMNDDDELPDYASSQAEAQAAQRNGAVRRAAELQIRWQRSNR